MALAPFDGSTGFDEAALPWVRADPVTLSLGSNEPPSPTGTLARRSAAHEPDPDPVWNLGRGVARQSCATYYLRLTGAQAGHSVFGSHDAVTFVLLIGAGILPALPLMASAAVARRLDLATVGMRMYINPTLQFLTSISVFDESLQTARVVPFTLIWAGRSIACPRPRRCAVQSPPCCARQPAHRQRGAAVA
jgi:hypothetical protein